MTELNGDVEMKNADDQCDTVAILDAGAQYGKVLFYGLRLMTRQYVRTNIAKGNVLQYIWYIMTLELL